MLIAVKHLTSLSPGLELALDLLQGFTETAVGLLFRQHLQDLAKAHLVTQHGGGKLNEHHDIRQRRLGREIKKNGRYRKLGIAHFAKSICYFFLGVGTLAAVKLLLPG